MSEDRAMAMAMTIRRGNGWALGLLLAGAVAACQPADGSPPPAEGSPETFARVVKIEARPVQADTFVDYIRATGEVEAMSDVTLSAEETGVIREFYVSKGAAVRAGQPIVKIDDAVLAAQLNEARAAEQLARERYQRQRQVWEEEKIGSEMGYLQAKSQAEVAAARAAALEARLARTVIRAPVAGVFDEKFLEVGEMATPGSRIGRVVAARRVKVTAGIPERFAADVAAGAPARVSFDIFPGEHYAGRVGFVGSTVDPGNRTFPIEIVIDNPRRLIKPRMVANVHVVRQRLSGVIVLPQDLVMRTEQGYQVFVVTERDGASYAEARPVTLGPSYENRVVISEGVVAGDRVIRAGARLVDHGSRVQVVEGEEAGR
jgi:RND family efflux transporter MFP subunit